MKLTRLYDNKVVISRLTAVSGNRWAMATVTAAFGNLQPASGQQSQLSGGVYGKLYRIFIDSDVDMQEGDELKDTNGNIYTVRKGGLTRWHHGAMDFQEVLIDQKG